MEKPDWVPLNLRLMSHWQNYFIILLMLIIAAFAAHLIMLSLNLSNISSQGNS